MAGGKWHSLALVEVAPEISIDLAPDTEMTSGSSLIDFGETTLFGLAPIDRTFTIRNLGSADLKDVQPLFTGAQLFAFTVINNPPATIPPGGNADFTVRFVPTNAGINSATLRIVSNDRDENPFEIALTETAIGEFHWNEVVGAEWYNVYIQKDGRLWHSFWVEAAEGTAWTPEFSWTESESADWYQLYIQRNGALFKAIWLEGSATTLHEETAEMPTGEYKYWVNPWSFSGGFGPWVGPKEFSIGIPVPLTPGGLQTSGVTQPVFTWTGSAKNEWYQIYLQRNGVKAADPWLPSNGVVNETWDMSVANPDTIPANLTLELTGGEYRWWIRGYNAADGIGGWVEGPAFTIRED